MLSFTCSDKVCILLTELVTRIVQCLVERTFTTIISDLIDIYFRMFINNCRHLLFCQLEVNNCAQLLFFQLLERFHQPTNFITNDHSIVDNISSATIADKISPARIADKTATIQFTARMSFGQIKCYLHPCNHGGRLRLRGILFLQRFLDFNYLQ